MPKINFPYPADILKYINMDLDSKLSYILLITYNIDVVLGHFIRLQFW